MRRKTGIRRLLAALLLSVPQWTAAQVNIPDTIAGKGFFVSQLNLAKRITDFFLDKRDAANATKLDSNYVGNYPEKLMFSAGLSSSGGYLKSSNDDSGYKLNSDLSNTINLRACYRGLAISFSINPFNMFGNSDTEFDISLYGDKTVFDFVYQNSETLSGSYTSGVNPEDNQDIRKGLINRRTMMVGGMYVFNSRRFSYAAAFDQTCIQKRSCGSFLLGANYQYSRLRMDLNEVGNLYFKSKMFGIGGGYGYNLVLPRRWLISATGLVELGVWTQNRIELSQQFVDIYNYLYEAVGSDTRVEKEQDYSYDHMPIIVIPRLAITHHFGRCFAGLTGLADMHFDKQDGDTNSHIVFVTNLLFGIRL